MDSTTNPEVSELEEDAFSIKWEGRFDQLKGKAQKLWGDLTDDVFDSAEGNARTLVGKIKEKTGEEAEQIKRKLNES